MNPWEMYDSVSYTRGATKRESAKHRVQNRLSRQIPGILSYHQAMVDDEWRDLVVINSDNLNIKTVCTLPGEDIRHGAIVEWNNYHWLVTERDANTEIYTKAKIEQCNYLLRWVDPVTKTVVERWTIVEDGTKYLTGEFGDNMFVMNIGDSRVSVTIPKDEYSLRLNRESRFIIDDYDAPSPLAYRLTKPYKLGGSFDENGVLRFVMTECSTENDDDLIRHIADYYSFFPDDREDTEVPDSPPISDDRTVWI